MKKLVVLFVSILTFSLIYTNVSADEEVYYTNANGVSMSESEYNYFVSVADEDYPDVVTQDIYDKFTNYGYFGQPITRVEYDESANMQQMIIPSVLPQGTVHETQAKKLVLVKACGSTYCGITVTLDWKGQPVVKSWDVMGALLYGNLSLVGDPYTDLTYSGGTITYNDPYYVGGGFGTSVKLQTSTTNMRAYQSYDVYGTGTVFASYQHATTSITKTNSKKYTIGIGGYGGVFHFYGAAEGVYDHMGGVNVGVSI
jgi:hypothetical protein